MTSTDTIVAAGKRLARALLKDTGYCPDLGFVGIRTSKTGCDTIATQEGFDIRIDRNRGDATELSAGTLAARVYHAAAHMLCIQAGVSSHSGSGRHTQMFEQALEQLGAPTDAPEDEFIQKLTKSQALAAEAFAKAVSQRKRTRPNTSKTAYERSTVYCDEPTCKHQITLRTSAITKTRFLCVEHGEEMTTDPEWKTA